MEMLHREHRPYGDDGEVHCAYMIYNLQGWAARSVQFRRGPPHGCTSQALLVSLQENEAEGIPHATMYLFSSVSIVETGTERICHTFHHPWAHLPNMAILGCLPPFEPISTN